MDLSRIPIPPEAPDIIPVVIEIAAQSAPIKYEFDKNCGGIVVDRIMPVAMFYPLNYGFIPQTLGGDGDPLDVLLPCEYPLMPGSVIACRPIGVLQMRDEDGQDEKIVAVPAPAVSGLYDHITEIDQLQPLEKQRIQHFFEHYKDLEPEKWVQLSGYGSAGQAKALIKQALQPA